MQSQCLITIADQRFQGGLSTAGGSVTLGLIADLYEPETQQFPLAFIVLSSTIGTSIGGVIGGPIERCKYSYQSNDKTQD